MFFPFLAEHRCSLTCHEPQSFTIRRRKQTTRLLLQTFAFVLACTWLSLQSSGRNSFSEEFASDFRQVKAFPSLSHGEAEPSCSTSLHNVCSFNIHLVAHRAQYFPTCSLDVMHARPARRDLLQLDSLARYTRRCVLAYRYYSSRWRFFTLNIHGHGQYRSLWLFPTLHWSHCRRTVSSAAVKSYSHCSIAVSVVKQQHQFIAKPQCFGLVLRCYI